MIAIRLVRSKLRKREDHGNDQSHTDQPSVVQTATPAQTVVTTNGDIRNNGIVNNGAIITASELSNAIITDGDTEFVNETNAEQFIWQFPPPYPPLTPPPQYTLYNDQVNNIFSSLI